MTIIFFIIALLGGLGLFIELSSPYLAAAPQHADNIRLCSYALLIGGIGMVGSVLHGSTARNGDRQAMEPGFHIERTCDQYQMTVGLDAMKKALATGEYEYIGPGYDVETGRDYDDDRLN